MINFGSNDTLYRLHSNALRSGSSNATNSVENSANSNYHTPFITSTATECLEASGRCHVNTSTQKNKQQSLEEYADSLRKQGKIEGKDFKIEHFPMYDNYNLYEYDSQGREIKENYWCGGNKASNKSDYMISEYNNDVKISKSYSNDGDLLYVDELYPNVRKEDLEETKFLYANPGDYCKYLESQGKVKNKDYIIEKTIIENNDGTKQIDIFINELSPKGVRQKKLWWTFIDNKIEMSVSYYDENGKEKIRKSYNSYGTSETTYYPKKH